MKKLIWLLLILLLLVLSIIPAQISVTPSQLQEFKNFFHQDKINVDIVHSKDKTVKYVIYSTPDARSLKERYKCIGRCDQATKVVKP